MNIMLTGSSQCCTEFFLIKELTVKKMLLEGLKLMIVGMASVMLFLLLLIVCVELIKFLTRNFRMMQEQSLLINRKTVSNKYKDVPNLEVPVEVFASAIAYYELDNNNT